MNTQSTFPSLDILKNGLKALEDQIKEQKKTLEAKLSKNQKILSDDERWLDGNANLVDKIRLVKALENAADYGKSIQGLDAMQMSILRKVQEAGQGQDMVEPSTSKVVGKKRKRMSQLNPYRDQFEWLSSLYLRSHTTETTTTMR